jgi:hypothetical protein
MIGKLRVRCPVTDVETLTSRPLTAHQATFREPSPGRIDPRILSHNGVLFPSRRAR